MIKSIFLFVPHFARCAWSIFLAFALPSEISAADAAPATPRAGGNAPKPANNNTGLEFIDSSFENASPVWYEFAPDGVIQVHLLYDHERSSPNRAAGHIHLLLHAKPGSKLTLEFKNLDNVWNGTVGDGWLERYGIDAVVHEFNCNWIAGVKDYPSGRHWQDYGEKLAVVFHEYFGAIEP